ncbi:hypothetical protein [Lysinibacillus sp. Y5S-8]|uniref:hypothetical protein n=1 Tax=Lysinibacillus sp. Y5S-8 TaxID=3122488 RepID=UPI0030CF4DA4
MRIEQREDVVIKNGLEISGSIQKNKKCTTCQSQIIYDDTFDSYFCASCNEWLEEACEDPHLHLLRPTTRLPIVRQSLNFFIFMFDKKSMIRYSN